MSVIRRFCQRGVAEFFARVDISSFVEQVANYIQSPLAGSQKERRAAITARVNVRAGEMKQPHTTEISIHRGLGKVSLPLFLDARQGVDDRQRKSKCAGKGRSSRQNQLCCIAIHLLCGTDFSLCCQLKKDHRLKSVPSIPCRRCRSSVDAAS